MNHRAILRTFLGAVLVGTTTLGQSCPTTTPAPDTTATIPFDSFRLDVPAGGPLNNYDRTFPIYAGPQTRDFSLRLNVSSLPSGGSVVLQRGDSTIVQTVTSNGVVVSGMFGGNVARLRVRLPGLTVVPPTVVLESITVRRRSAKQFPAVTPLANTVSAFPLTLGEPVDFVLSDSAARDDVYFSVSGVAGAPLDVILTGAATVWFEAPQLDGFPLSPTEASTPFTPTRGPAPSFSFPTFALFRFGSGVAPVLRMTITNQGLTRVSGVRDPFHMRVIAVAAEPALALSFPSITPQAFLPFPIGVDTNPAPTVGNTGTAMDQLDCTNWAGAAAGTPLVVGPVTTIVPSGRLVCYDTHTGSDFLIAPPAMALNVPVSAAASGIVVQTATGNVDTCIADPTAAAGVSCPGTAALAPNFVVVRQDDGLFARYYHLKNDPPPVRPGDRVTCGQLLGHVGSSGISATPHLHFELNRLSPLQVSPVVSNVDALIGSLMSTPGVVVDPYPGSWRALAPGTVPLFACP